jgi:hypothetical protein
MYLPVAVDQKFIQPCSRDRPPDAAFSIQHKVDVRRGVISISSELCFAMRVPLYIREWERQEADTQTNFFFEGSPSHMASLTLYRGLLRALMAFANGSSVTVGVRAVAAGDMSNCRL